MPFATVTPVFILRTDATTYYVHDANATAFGLRAPRWRSPCCPFLLDMVCTRSRAHRRVDACRTNTCVATATRTFVCLLTVLKLPVGCRGRTHYMDAAIRAPFGRCAVPGRFNTYAARCAFTFGFFAWHAPRCLLPRTSGLCIALQHATTNTTR